MKSRILVNAVILTGFFIILTVGCNKEDKNKPPVTVKDIDGNVYNTIVIGTQTWMAENLTVTRFKNGD